MPSSTQSEWEWDPAICIIPAGTWYIPLKNEPTWFRRVIRGGGTYLYTYFLLERYVRVYRLTFTDDRKWRAFCRNTLYKLMHRRKWRGLSRAKERDIECWVVNGCSYSSCLIRGTYYGYVPLKTISKVYKLLRLAEKLNRVQLVTPPAISDDLA